MAHQIKHFFQYQEEKQQQRSESWDESGDFSMKKPSIPRPHDTMDAAELSYYEHKSKLRKTQVNHRVTGDEGHETPDDVGEPRPGEKLGGRSGGHPYGRPGELGNTWENPDMLLSYWTVADASANLQVNGGAKSERRCGPHRPPWWRSTTTGRSSLS